MMLTYAAGSALIAGGSGGIGAAVVACLSDAGVPVGFTYHSRREAAEEMVKARGDGAPVRAYALAGSAAEEAAALVGQVKADLGDVRYLVHCAGIGQESAFFGMGEQEWLRILDVNLTSAVSLARAAITPFLKAGAGRILFISSVSGLRGIKGHTVYAASKAGLDGLTRSLAQECASFGVTVNSIAPGYIDTPMVAELPAARRKELLRHIPAGRFGVPEEVAHLVAYLCSEQAAYVTGQTWVIDGGISL